MKKIIISLLGISFALASFAQPGIRFSVFANPAINWFQSDNNKVGANEGSVIGFDAGLTVDKYFAENYAITSGISIGNFGGKVLYKNAVIFKSESGDSYTVPANTKVDYKLQYLTIPIGLKFKTKEIGYITYFAHLGLTNQFNIKARGNSGETNNPALDNTNIKPEINVFNMGYHIGAGIQYSLGGNTALVAGITFTNGFLDITKNDKVDLTTTNLALRLGILF